MMRNRFAPHIDFAEFEGLLGSILPSNLDMIVERHGYFLVAEWKHPKERVSKGQEILLKSLARMKNFTVIVISGDSAETMMVHKFWKIQKDGSLTLIGTSLHELKEFLIDWLYYINQ